VFRLNVQYRELDKASVETLCARAVERAQARERALPAFVSAAPPRSEGEALLRRIFSRAERA
jgi:hypothetical protein